MQNSERRRSSRFRKSRRRCLRVSRRFVLGKRVASFPDTNLQVRLYHMKDEPGQKSSVVKLEIYDPKQKKRHQPHQEDSATIGPLSPDGKYLLVEAGQGRSDWIYVIRNDGTVVDKVGINEAR